MGKDDADKGEGWGENPVEKVMRDLFRQQQAAAPRRIEFRVSRLELVEHFLDRAAHHEKLVTAQVSVSPEFLTSGLPMSAADQVIEQFRERAKIAAARYAYMASHLGEGEHFTLSLDELAYYELVPPGRESPSLVLPRPK